jgi:hypothetical protein
MNMLKTVLAAHALAVPIYVIARAAHRSVIGISFELRCQVKSAEEQGE